MALLLTGDCSFQTNDFGILDENEVIRNLLLSFHDAGDLSSFFKYTALFTMKHEIPCAFGLLGYFHYNASGPGRRDAIPFLEKACALNYVPSFHFLVRSYYEANEKNKCLELLEYLKHRPYLVWGTTVISDIPSIILTWLGIDDIDKKIFFMHFGGYDRDVYYILANMSLGYDMNVLRKGAELCNFMSIRLIAAHHMDKKIQLNTEEQHELRHAVETVLSHRDFYCDLVTCDLVFSYFVEHDIYNEAMIDYCAVRLLYNIFYSEARSQTAKCYARQKKIFAMFYLNMMFYNDEHPCDDLKQVYKIIKEPYQCPISLEWDDYCVQLIKCGHMFSARVFQCTNCPLCRSVIKK